VSVADSWSQETNHTGMTQAHAHYVWAQTDSTLFNLFSVKAATNPVSVDVGYRPWLPMFPRHRLSFYKAATPPRIPDP
jgi:hypothetical protein